MKQNLFSKIMACVLAIIMVWSSLSMYPVSAQAAGSSSGSAAVTTADEEEDGDEVPVPEIPDVYPELQLGSTRITTASPAGDFVVYGFEPPMTGITPYQFTIKNLNDNSMVEVGYFNEDGMYQVIEYLYDESQTSREFYCTKDEIQFLTFYSDQPLNIEVITTTNYLIDVDIAEGTSVTASASDTIVFNAFYQKTVGEGIADPENIHYTLSKYSVSWTDEEEPDFNYEPIPGMSFTGAEAAFVLTPDMFVDPEADGTDSYSQMFRMTAEYNGETRYIYLDVTVRPALLELPITAQLGDTGNTFTASIPAHGSVCYRYDHMPDSDYFNYVFTVYPAKNAANISLEVLNQYGVPVDVFNIPETSNYQAVTPLSGDEYVYLIVHNNADIDYNDKLTIPVTGMDFYFGADGTQYPSVYSSDGAYLGVYSSEESTRYYWYIYEGNTVWSKLEEDYQKSGTESQIYLDARRLRIGYGVNNTVFDRYVRCWIHKDNYDVDVYFKVNVTVDFDGLDGSSLDSAIPFDGEINSGEYIGEKWFVMPVTFTGRHTIYLRSSSYPDSELIYDLYDQNLNAIYEEIPVSFGDEASVRLDDIYLTEGDLLYFCVYSATPWIPNISVRTNSIDITALGDTDLKVENEDELDLTAQFEVNDPSFDGNVSNVSIRWYLYCYGFDYGDLSFTRNGNVTSAKVDLDLLKNRINLRYQESVSVYVICEVNAGHESDSCIFTLNLDDVLCIANGHFAKVVNGYDSTCSETGLTDGSVCRVCGEVLEEQTVIPMKAHTEVTIKGTAATCTKTGLTAGKKCSVCGEILQAQTVIPMKAHTEVSIPAVAATYTKTGLTEGKKCSVCGEILKAQKTVAKKTLDAPTSTSIMSSGYGLLISWNKVPNASGYYVARKEAGASSFKRIATINSSSTLSYSDSTAVSGTKYIYQIRGFVTEDGETVSGPTMQTAGFIFVEKMEKPTLTKVNTGFKLSWSESEGATGYQIYRSKDGGSYTLLKKIEDSSITTYSNTGLSNGSTYSYKIKAYKVDPDSSTSTYGGDFSKIVSGVFVSRVAAPTLTMLDNGIKLSWKANENATGYEIYRSKNGGDYALWKTIGKGTTVTTSNTGLTNGADYSYKIYTVLEKDGTEYRSTFSQASDLTFVAPVSDTAVSNTVDGLKLTWSENKKADGYQIYRCKDGGSFSLFKTINDGSTVSFENTGLTNGVTYSYKVYAFVLDGDKKIKSTASDEVTTVRLKRVSFDTLTSPAKNRIKLTWTANEKADGYQIQYSTTSDFASVKSVTVTNPAAVSKAITSADNLVSGKKYYVRIRAYKTVDGTKKYSAWSVKKNIVVK